MAAHTSYDIGMAAIFLRPPERDIVAQLHNGLVPQLVDPAVRALRLDNFMPRNLRVTGQGCRPDQAERQFDPGCLCGAAGLVARRRSGTSLAAIAYYWNDLPGSAAAFARRFSR